MFVPRFLPVDQSLQASVELAFGQGLHTKRGGVEMIYRDRRGKDFRGLVRLRGGRGARQEIIAGKQQSTGTQREKLPSIHDFAPSMVG